MQEVMQLVNEVVEALSSEHNLGKESGKDMLLYVRPTVEKYLFKKLSDDLFDMYALKNETEDDLFMERSSKIQMMEPQAAMEYLGIRKKLMPNDESSEELSNSSSDEDQTSRKVSPRSARRNVPYIDAIREIERIQHCSSPEEMIGCLSASYEKLKTAVVEQHKGKFELEAMDDVLPLSIYVVSMAKLEQASSHKNMMEDYLRINQRGYDLERKLMCNFDCAIRYVSTEWELEE